MSLGDLGERAAGDLGSDVPARLGRRSVVDDATAYLRQAILTGELAAGEAFSATALAEKLGVSHIPVREALRNMEAEGFVHLRPGRQAVVAPLNAEDATEVFALRGAVESFALRRAAERYEDEDLDALRDLIEGMRLAAADQDEERFAALHVEFEMALLKPAMSPWMGRVLALLRQATSRYYRLLLAGSDSMELGVEEHERLVDAAAKRDGDELCRALEEHLDHSLASALLALDSLPGSHPRGADDG